MPVLRAAEWLSLLAFAGFMALAWLVGLDRARRAKIAAAGFGGIGLTLLISVVTPRVLPPLWAAVVRDWLPCLLPLLFYNLAGQFVTRADAASEARLERFDLRWVAPPLEWCARRPVGHAILTYAELAYMSYYPLMPAAVGALYGTGARGQADRFWTVVLLATYISCGMLAVIQTRPPRFIGEKWSEVLPRGRVRAFNLWILRRGSIQANTFPSAHVAIATACALALLRVGPAGVGLVFLWVAVSIALGAVAGRYHYGADAVFGFLTAAAACLAGAALAG